MTDTSAVVSAVASAVSAAGGAFAAVAAFRSAASAKRAEKILVASEKQAAIRQLALSANQILVEARQIEALGGYLKSGYETLAIFAGSYGGSRKKIHISAVDDRLAEVKILSGHAEPFASIQENFMDDSVSEISLKGTWLSQLLNQVRGIKEMLERQHASVERECAAERDMSLRSRR